MYKGTTPTFTLTFPEDVDLGQAANVYVTFSRKDLKKLFTKSGSDLVIDGNVVEVFLNQSETLDFPSGTVLLQVNWTYADGKRACSEIAKVMYTANLEAGVLS